MSSWPNPYVTSNWVRGSRFYGRKALLNEVLRGANHAVWLVGNSRNGKTSFLRQAELLSDTQSQWTALYLDLAGVENEETFAAELQIALEKQADRFALDDIDVAALRGAEPFSALRAVRQAAENHQRRLLLLLDNGDTLLAVAENDRPALVQIHKFIFGAAQLSTVLASTQRLNFLNTQTKDWLPTPFLQSFALRNLGPLTLPALRQLIRQAQQPHAVMVDDQQIDAIWSAIGGHPFLAQYLCQRLFVAEKGILRPVHEDELRIDIFLAGYFEAHFNALDLVERIILQAVFQNAPIAEEDLLQRLLPFPAGRWHLSTLCERGYLRKTGEGYWLNGQLWQQWLSIRRKIQYRGEDERAAPTISMAASIMDAQQQQQVWRLQLRQAQKDLARLELQRAHFGLMPPLSLLNEIEQIEARIQALEEQLSHRADSNQASDIPKRTPRVEK